MIFGNQLLPNMIIQSHTDISSGFQHPFAAEKQQLPYDSLSIFIDRINLGSILAQI